MPTAQPVLVLVHGTNDGSLPDQATCDTVRWWWAESAFCHWLNLRILTKQGDDLGSPGTVVRFQWSGENLESAREIGAKRLASSLSQLAEDGRRIHIIAHSHGGNVVRRALELAGKNSPGTVSAVGSVISFGTPFLHYSGAKRLSFAVSTLLILFLTAAATVLFLEQDITSPLKELGLSICVGFLIPSTMSALSSFRRLHYRSAHTVRHLVKSVPWTNYCSAKDEAVLLLTSLNTNLRLMRRKDPFLRWPNGVKFSSFLLTIALTILVSAHAAELFTSMRNEFPEHGPSWPFIVIAVACIGLLVFCHATFLMVWALSHIMDATMASVDILISGRIRAIVFGDDVHHGVTGAERYAWSGAQHHYVALPECVENCLEAVVADSSTSLWKNFRTAFDPLKSIAEQDWREIAETTLTWNEFAHTAYARLRPFVDLLIVRLVETGDWVLQTTLSAPPEAVWDDVSQRSHLASPSVSRDKPMAAPSANLVSSTPTNGLRLPNSPLARRMLY